MYTTKKVVDFLGSRGARNWLKIIPLRANPCNLARGKKVPVEKIFPDDSSK